MTLSSISYNPETHKLSVLDQTKLPNEESTIPVSGSEDAWNIIRNMQVRGAPLIAIVAMLGISVELARSPEFEGSKQESATEASDYIIQRLNFMRTSRPTAVNLFNACDSMTTLVSDLAKDQSNSGKSIRQAFIEAASAMLSNDLAANHRQGLFGVKAILHDCSKKLEGCGKKVSVLTHCNTGSLACAGFGTALGVIRALHAKDMLESCYATETRPYNQGARLTCFEMVYDKLPGTLITDSMASFLMQQKKVDLVVTGADRIAKNGDTANKIGTYQLAISAKYHNIPFYIVASSDTIDMSIENGSQIEIEQRPEQELTHINGHRIAAPGIGVWNPAFDVTPAELITAIITDKGIVRPILQPDGTKIFSMERLLLDVANISSTEEAKLPENRDGYYPLTEGRVCEFISKNPVLAEMLGAEKPSQMKHTEIGDGNLNLVFLCTGPKGSIIVKQALPYVRCVGEEWPLTLERARFEYEALLRQYSFCPEHTPQVFHFDPVLRAFAMQYLEPPHVIMRSALISGEQFSNIGKHIALFLATTLFRSSALCLSASDFRSEVEKWSKNKDMCALTEQVVFTDPYTDSKINRWTSPQLDLLVAELKEDFNLKIAVTLLKEKFICSTEALIHGDLHTGSIMAMEGSTYCIDPEFAFYGPMGFDLGAIIGNLLLAYCSQPGYQPISSSISRLEHSNWILGQLVNLYTTFEVLFVELWDSHLSESADMYVRKIFSKDLEFKNVQQLFLRRLFEDAIGFAGAKMIRRITGIAHVADFENISDPDVRAKCELHAINIARKLLKDKASFQCIEDVVEFAKC